MPEHDFGSGVFEGRELAALFLFECCELFVDIHFDLLGALRLSCLSNLIVFSGLSIACVRVSCVRGCLWYLSPVKGTAALGRPGTGLALCRHLAYLQVGTVT